MWERNGETIIMCNNVSKHTLAVSGRTHRYIFFSQNESKKKLKEGNIECVCKCLSDYKRNFLFILFILSMNIFRTLVRNWLEWPFLYNVPFHRFRKISLMSCWNSFFSFFQLKIKIMNFEGFLQDFPGNLTFIIYKYDQ